MFYESRFQGKWKQLDKITYFTVCIADQAPRLSKHFHAQLSWLNVEILNAHKYKNQEIQFFSDKPRMLLFLLKKTGKISCSAELSKNMFYNLGGARTLISTLG